MLSHNVFAYIFALALRATTDLTLCKETVVMISGLVFAFRNYSKAYADSTKSALILTLGKLKKNPHTIDVN